MLFCYRTACRSLTARTEQLFSSIFKPPSGIDTEGKKIIIQTFLRRTMSASELNLSRRFADPQIVTVQIRPALHSVAHFCLLVFCAISDRGGGIHSFIHTGKGLRGV